MLAETTSSDDDQEEDHEVSLIINEEALVKNTNIFSITRLRADFRCILASNVMSLKRVLILVYFIQISRATVQSSRAEAEKVSEKKYGLNCLKIRKRKH